jgi:hypothetical protein
MPPRIEIREPSIATFELEPQDVAIEGDSALDVGNEEADIGQVTQGIEAHCQSLSYSVMFCISACNA